VGQETLKVSGATTPELELHLFQRHPIIRVPNGVEDNEEFTASEFGFLGTLAKRRYHVEINLVPLGVITVTTTITQFLPSWPDFPYTSKVFRFASLAFCTGLRNTNDWRIQGYLRLFHQYMHDAIDNKSVEEILFGSYAAMMFCVQMNYQFHDICILFGGICDTASLWRDKLQHHPGITEDLRTVDTVLFVSTETLRVAYFTSRDPLSDIDIDLIRGISENLQKVAGWHYRSPTPQPHFVKLTRLDLYWKFYLDIYLFSMQHPERMEVLQATDSLHQVLRDIVALIDHMPEPRKLINFALKTNSQDWPWLTVTS
jgi:hypothetical protein